MSASYSTSRQRLTRAVTVSGVAQADWLEDALTRFEGEGVSMEELGDEGSLPPVVELAVARKEIKGLREILAQQRERLGMADSLNIELSKRLEESHN